MVMLGADGAAVAVSAYHLSEGMVARLTDRETVLLLDPVLRRIAVPAAAAADLAAGIAPGAATAYTCLHVAAAEHYCIDGRPTKASARQMELHVTTFDS